MRKVYSKWTVFLTAGCTDGLHGLKLVLNRGFTGLFKLVQCLRYQTTEYFISQHRNKLHE